LAALYQLKYRLQGSGFECFNFVDDVMAAHQPQAWKPMPGIVNRWYNTLVARLASRRLIGRAVVKL